MNRVKGTEASAIVRRAVLAAIVCAYLVLAINYARSVPKWNAPDEPSHFNYVKNMALTGTFPILKQGDYDQDYLEKAKSARFPDSMSVDAIRYESHQPPLYYAIAIPIYWLGTAESFSLDRMVIALRLLSVLFGAATVVLTFIIADKLFNGVGNGKGDAVLPLAAAAFVAFEPMQLFMNAAIENDSLATLLLTAMLLALIVSLQRKKTSRLEKVRNGARETGNPLNFLDKESIVWGIMLGLGLLTKVTVYIAVFPIAFVVLWQEWSWQSPEQAGAPGNGQTPPVVVVVLRRATARLAQVYGIALLLAGWWFVRNAIVYGNLDIFGLKRHDQVVIGQPLTGPINAAAVERFVTISFKSFWGMFGWMGILMDDRIYRVLGLLTALAVLGLAIYALRTVLGRTSLAATQKVSLAVMLLAIVLVALGWLQYNLTYIQAQGRYLFPTIAAIAIFFNLGLRQLTFKRLEAAVFALLYLGFYALSFVSLYRFILPDLR